MSKKDKEKEDDWGVLIAKHKLRWEIWMLLYVYNELNITQISNFVKQSKSTVWRQLNDMEQDNLLFSRKIAGDYKGKIPPIFYRLNPDFIRQRTPPEIIEDKNPKDRRDYYRKTIKWYKNSILHLKKLLDLTTPLLDYFEQHLDDIEEADQIFETYLANKFAPKAFIWFFDKKRFKKYLKLNFEQYQKLIELENEQKADPDSDLKGFAHFEVRMPIQMLYEFQKKKFREV